VCVCLVFCRGMFEGREVAIKVVHHSSNTSSKVGGLNGFMALSS
jgi:hypothetical protein